MRLKSLFRIIIWSIICQSVCYLWQHISFHKIRKPLLFFLIVAIKKTVPIFVDRIFWGPAFVLL